MTASVVIDCDPGIDDAIALMVACSSLNVAGVTTVAGNGPIGQTTTNAAKVLTLCGCEDVPLASGMGAPLVRELTTAEEVHGEDGIGGVSFPAASVDPLDDHATELIDKIATATEAVTVVSIGPPTNVAAALRRHPSLCERLDRILVMAGSTQGGNVTPVAEFNAFVDPEALQIVVDADVPTTMVGLNVTWDARIDHHTIEALDAMEMPIPATAAELIRALGPFHATRDGWTAVPLHDALAVTVLLDESVIATEPMEVAVETHGQYTVGTTVCRPDADAPNVDVATEVDRRLFASLIVEAIESYA